MIFDEKFWIASSLIVLVILLYKKLSLVISKTLDGKTAEIRTRLDKAEEIIKEAEDIKQDIVKKHNEAQKRAEEMIENARIEAKHIREESKKNLNDKVSQKIKLSQDKINNAEKQIISEMRLKAIELATNAVKESATNIDNTNSFNAAVENAANKLN
jgi:F-type H+-transporting ATPase subunit b